MLQGIDLLLKLVLDFGKWSLLSLFMMVPLCLFWREGFVLRIRPNENGVSYGVVPGAGRAGDRLFLPNSKLSNHSKLAGERIARADTRQVLRKAWAAAYRNSPSDYLEAKHSIDPLTADHIFTVRLT